MSQKSYLKIVSQFNDCMTNDEKANEQLLKEKMQVIIALKKKLNVLEAKINDSFVLLDKTKLREARLNILYSLHEAKVSYKEMFDTFVY